MGDNTRHETTLCDGCEQQVPIASVLGDGVSHPCGDGAPCGPIATPLPPASAVVPEPDEPKLGFMLGQHDYAVRMLLDTTPGSGPVVIREDGTVGRLEQHGLGVGIGDVLYRIVGASPVSEEPTDG